MFGISGGEFLILIVVAVIFLGPKHAAQAIKALRTALGKLRDISSQLRSQLAENRSQPNLESLGITQEDLAALRELRATTGSLDPRAYVRKAVAEEMDAWLDVAPVPIRKATNVPSTGTALSFEEVRKKNVERQHVSTSANTDTHTAEAVESTQEEISQYTEKTSDPHTSVQSSDSDITERKKS